MIATIRRFLADIRVEHTLFALPFAYSGALLAQRGVPRLSTLAWITVAVVGARTAAMATNRLFDASIDAKNPRTSKRAVPSGALKPSVMIWATIVGLALLSVAAFALNPLCLALLPIGGAALIAYPFVKRWTWAVHFALGAVDGLAPLGAWLAVTGRFEAGALLLFAATTLWVAGFDILYALMDRDFDLRERVHSIPARFGQGRGQTMAKFSHALVVLLLLWLGLVVHARPLYWGGVLCALALLAYEVIVIRRRRDVFALNAAVLNANMAFSVLFLASTAASWL